MSEIILNFEKINTPPHLELISQANQTLGMSGTKIRFRLKVWDDQADVVTVSAVIDGVTKSQTLNTPVEKPTTYNCELEWDIVTDSISDGAYSSVVITADDGNDTNFTTYAGIIMVGTDPVIFVSNRVYPNITFGALNPFGNTLNSLEVKVNGVQKELFTTGLTSARTYTIDEEDMTGSADEVELVLTYDTSSTRERIFTVTAVEHYAVVEAHKSMQPVRPLQLHSSQLLNIRAFLNNQEMMKTVTPIEADKAISMCTAELDSEAWQPTIKFETVKSTYHQLRIEKMLGAVE